MRNMKNLNLAKLLSFVILTMFVLSFASCGSDDDTDEDASSDISVIIRDDGTTSNGCIFSAIDDKNFYLDYIKYTVKEGHLIVTGYDNIGFKGEAKIVSSITYKGNTYEVLEIGDGAFEDCDILKSVILSNSITTIGFSAFYRCKNLTTVTFGKNLRTIKFSVFAYSSLNLIDFGNSLITTVGVEAFDNTPWYNSQPDGLVYIGLVAYKYKGSPTESSIVIKDGTTYIARGAFNVSGLTSVVIPNSVTNIGANSFKGCTDLTSITIGSGVTDIGECAFRGCPLSSIHCKAKTPPYIDYTFDTNTYANATLYVPYGSFDAYIKSSSWGRFNNIVGE